MGHAPSPKFRGRYETSKVCFLIVSSTASYAASKKQPIFSGCFLGWRLANYNIQGACYEISGAFLLILLRHLVPLKKQPISYNCFLSGVSINYKMLFFLTHA
jgi:hypothetical protein